jgi:hypothetical protein
VNQILKGGHKVLISLVFGHFFREFGGAPEGYFINLKTAGVLFLVILLGLLIASRSRRPDIKSFRGTVAALFGIGFVLIFFPVPYLDEGFAHSFGDALIIAAILAITVDFYLKDRVLREVSSDVSKYLVGYRLPGEVQDRIRSLLQTRWIKRNCRVRLRLIDVGDGKVLVEIRASRNVENITTEEASFQDKITYERHLPQTIVEMRCDSADTKAQYQLNGHGLANEKADEPGVMEALGRTIKIPPVHESAGTYYQFTILYEATYPENYSDIFAFDLPTINVVVEAECAAGFRITLPPADITTPNRWEYNRLFLTGEHIRYRWERVPPQEINHGDVTG